MPVSADPKVAFPRPPARLPRVAWLCGLSGAGKSTIAREARARLEAIGQRACVLDGDELRRGLCRDLGFSRQDRRENLRRAGEVAALMADTGLFVIAAFITPERTQRQDLRAIVGHSRFLEVWVRAPLALCEARDPKGLYAKARAGAIPEFTGVSAPFEDPSSPDLVLETERTSVQECAESLVRELLSGGQHRGNVAS